MPEAEGEVILRVYKRAECDAQGSPLDWERCRACVGNGGKYRPRSQDGGWEPCPVCDGHGSLKDAALAALIAYIKERA